MALRTENILSLFSGIGGLDLGVAAAIRSLGRAPRTVCMVEGEVFSASCLAAKMEAGALDASPIWSDVRTFNARAWRGVVDGVIGGFPCQDLSSAGKHAGIKGAKSGLFFELMRIVHDVEPRWVFLENVSAILVRGLNVVLGELAALGYDAEWCCLRASDVGAPHRRDRWFCLAYRDGNGPQRLKPAGRAAAQAFGASRTKVAHPHGGRLEGERRTQREPELPRRAEPDGCNVPRWPPRPDDIDGWRRILAERPDLAPAIKSGVRGVDDGASIRVDRLRALGNAVVPAQAEAAFLELSCRR